MRSVFIVASLLFVTVFPNRGSAQRPAFPRLLPDTTILMLRLDDAAKFRETLKASSIGKLMQDPQLRPFVEQLTGDFGEWVAEQGKAFELQLGQLIDIPQGEFGFALIAADPPQSPPASAGNASAENSAEPNPRRGRRPPFDIVILLDAKDQAPAVRKLIEQLETRAPARMKKTEVAVGNDTIHNWTRDDQRNFAWVEREGTFIVSNQSTRIEEMLASWNTPGKPGLLAAKQAFSAAISPCIGNGTEIPQISFFFDPVGLVRSAAARNTGMQITLQLLEPFGLTNIRGIGATALLGGQQYDSLLQAHFVLDGARTGLLGLIQPIAGDLRPEAWVPSDVASYSTLRWDVKKTVQALENVLEKVAGGQYWELNVEDRFQERYGVNLQTDVIEQVTGRATMIQWFEPPARLGSQVTLLAIEVADSAVAEKIMETALQKFPSVGKRESYGAASLYRLREPVQSGEEAVFRRGVPHLMMLENYIFVCDSRPLLEKLVNTANSADTERLADHPDYITTAIELMTLLGDHEPFYLSFNDPSESLRGVYELAKSQKIRDQLQKMGERFAPAGMLGKALLSNELPPFAVVEQYFAPGGSAAYSEPTGLHFMSFGARP